MRDLGWVFRLIEKNRKGQKFESAWYFVEKYLIGLLSNDPKSTWKGRFSGSYL